jgi:hypothetical protein
MVAKHGESHGLGRQAAQISESGGRYSVADPQIRQEILDLRLNPALNAAMAGEYANDNRAHLERTTSRTDIGPTDLYLAHFLGAGGASEFLNAMDRSPGRSGADLFPAAARANRAIFNNPDGSARTLEQIYNRFAGQVRRDMAMAADLPDAAAGGFSGINGGGAHGGVNDFWTGGSGRGPIFGAGTSSGGMPGVANAASWLQMASGEGPARDIEGRLSGRDLSLWTVLALSSMSAPGEATLTGDNSDGDGNSDSSKGRDAQGWDAQGWDAQGWDAQGRNDGDERGRTRFAPTGV